MVGYSSTPLLKKLGIKDGYRIYTKNEPEQYFLWLAPLPQKVVVTTRLSSNLDFIHLFVKERSVLQSEFTKCKKALSKEGMFWVSWPKKTSKVLTDLDENIIRELGLKMGLVDVKVCAVDEVWSALKFVYRVGDR
jgi:hypothetical protein